MDINYRDMPNNDILCLDMKAFYASVECVSRNLDPLTDYLAVVGDTDRPGAVVLAASPKLKKDFGIKTGSRLFDIPDDPAIHIVNARMNYYIMVSVKLTELLNSFVPLEAISVYSIDEAFLNINGVGTLYGGDKWHVAKMIVDTIQSDFGLPACIGMGPNKFLAKIALDNYAKKERIAECRYEDVPEKLWPLPVEDMFGVGRRMTDNLLRTGIVTVHQLAHFPLKLLRKRFGVIGEELYWHAWGVDFSRVTYDGKTAFDEPKSFSKGITLLRDYRGEEVKICILDLVEEVAKRAREQRMAGRTVSLSVGYSKAEGGGGFSRSRSVPEPTNITMEIYRVCLELLEENDTGGIVRVVHVSLSKIERDVYTQLNLFEDKAKEKELAYTVDWIRNKYGQDAILRASSYIKGGITKSRTDIIGGHKA